MHYRYWSKKMNSKPFPLKKVALLVAIFSLVGCSVNPELATQDEVRDRVKGDTALMYQDQAPIDHPVTLEEVIARSLKYNLDYRLKKMESALALGLADYASYDMLPKLVTAAGYRVRGNDSGGTSVGIVDGIQSLRPSTSEDRKFSIASAEFSWNALDFGVSYYRSRQQANQFLIAEERRRKVVQNLVQDARSAYWRALGAQRLAVQTKEILERAHLALTRSREAEVQRVISPYQALNYQRALLDTISFLNQRRQDLEFANRELAAMMNAHPDATIIVAEATEAKLPAAPTDILKLEELALLQRPELREEDFKKRITSDEARKQLLSMLPGISFDASTQYNSNALLYNNSWNQGGVKVSWNLFQLFSLPSLKLTQEQQVKTDQARRMALSMAVITQLRIGVARYRLALEDFEISSTSAQVDLRMANYMRSAVSARLDNDLEAIRTQARAVLGNYQRANAYANAQISFGRLYNTLGFDPLPDDFEGNDIPELTARVKSHLAFTEKETLKMSSTLFSNIPSVAIKLVGVEDPVLVVRMKAQISELLKRNQITLDAEHGVPLTLSLQRDMKDGLEKINWTFALRDFKGQTKGNSVYASTLPTNARDSVYEATLMAAATSRLSKIKNWLSDMALEDK
jgi:outer membrane protein TolC